MLTASSTLVALALAPSATLMLAHPGHPGDGAATSHVLVHVVGLLAVVVPVALGALALRFGRRARHDAR